MKRLLLVVLATFLSCTTVQLQVTPGTNLADEQGLVCHYKPGEPMKCMGFEEFLIRSEAAQVKRPPNSF